MKAFELFLRITHLSCFQISNRCLISDKSWPNNWTQTGVRQVLHVLTCLITLEGEIEERETYTLYANNDSLKVGISYIHTKRYNSVLLIRLSGNKGKPLPNTRSLSWRIKMFDGLRMFTGSAMNHFSRFDPAHLGWLEIAEHHHHPVKHVCLGYITNPAHYGPRDKGLSCRIEINWIYLGVSIKWLTTAKYYLNQFSRRINDQLLDDYQLGQCGPLEYRVDEELLNLILQRR